MSMTPEQLVDAKRLISRIAEYQLVDHDGIDLLFYLTEEVERLRKVITEYDATINWYTTCHNCASLLDKNYEQYCEIEKLKYERNEASLAALDVRSDPPGWTQDESGNRYDAEGNWYA